MKVQTSITNNNYKILHVQKDSPISLVLFLTKNGTRYETEKDAGISHFIEHMMFKSTEQRKSSKDISMEIESIGGVTNAFTSHEYTGYYIQVLNEHFDHAFEILSDLLQNGIFDPKDIEIEKGVVIEEIKMYEDSPSDKVGEVAQRNIFPNSALGSPVLGTEESVKSFTREQLINFIQTNYLQEDFLIVSAGNFEIEKLKANTEKYLKERKAGSLSLTKAEFSPKDKINFVEKKDSNQAHTVISFPGVNTFDKDLIKYEILDMVLGGGMGSILWDLLREKLGVAYYVGANHSDHLDTGTFQIIFGANFDKTKLTIEKIFEELEKIKTELITEEELNRAKNLAYSHMAMRHESIGYLGQSYGLHYLLENKVQTLEEKKKEIFDVTAEDIKKTAQKVFTDNYNITYIANKELL